MVKSLRLLVVFACFFLLNGCSCSSDDTGTPPGGSGSCGDGNVDGDEACDDGNKTDGDGCSATCQNEGGPNCGDGKLDDGEECDDGNKVEGDGCSAACVSDPGCGNGKLEKGEACDDGNMRDGDGCQADCTNTPTPVVICDTLDPLPSGTCTVTAGDDSKLIIGDVLTPGKIYRGGQVAVDPGGQITCVGCDCAGGAAGATQITCPKGIISPGLINTHDHITYTQNSPYSDTGERYEHRHDWRKGKNGHTKISTAGGASNDEVTWGELRFLMGGATSTVGSGSAPGLLRNLDKSADEEGLNEPAVHFQTFPLDDSDGTQLASGCGYGSGADTESSIAGDDAYEPHISEGINDFARNEFVCASSNDNGGNDLVKPQSAFIHSIGLTAPDYALMAGDGTAVIWSPRSNITLYGDTAVVTEAARLGVLIALGTDWVATGSMNMLRELRCADELNKSYYGGYFTDEQLWLMTTRNAAQVTATDDKLGTLESGRLADITIFDGATHKDHRAVIAAEAKDVALVMRAGKVLYGDEAVVTTIPGSGACDAVDVCGSPKQLCISDDIGKGFPALKTAVGNIYDAFFCGDPDNEPSCVPTRPEGVMGSSVYTGVASATDGDGDGIDDAEDDCPTVFNPIRPVDKGKQADFDSDGEGDACDVCPLNANTSNCSSVNPNDQDSDGVTNTSDNCPTVSNTDQADGDMDGKGDVCDPCPNEANPGPQACVVTVYDIKDGTVIEGSNVALESLVVTGRFASGFFLQVKPGDPSYVAPANSGIFVYAPANTVKVGDRVTVTNAVVKDFFGQIQLTGTVFAIDSSLGEASPAPVVATAAELATGGAKAAELESVIVQVANVVVSDVAPAPGTADMPPTNEFAVDAGLRVNDLLYLTTPFPALGQSFTSITGILDFRNDNSKIEPRSVSDLVTGDPILLGLGPTPTFADQGQIGQPTFPQPLTVQLSSAVASDTFVSIVSSDPASLTVVGNGVTVPAGQSAAPVLVNGLAQALAVTLTATLDASTKMATVRVLGPAEQPTLASLTPMSTSVGPGGTATFTVTLDIPAPVGGTAVSVSLNPANAGTVPATVTVLADQISATFNYVDGGTVSSATVSATLGATTLNASITIGSVGGGLVINEVDYDSVGANDAAEFVEIFNSGAAPVPLQNISVVLINGVNSPGVGYLTQSLAAAGTLAPGQYLVLAGSGVSVPGTALSIPLTKATDNIQNGPSDGLALIDTSTSTLIDAFCYEGAIATANVPPLGMVSLVEGTVLPAATADSNTAQGSLCRLPNGTDSDNAATDWNFTSTPTPGAANVP